MGDSTSARWPRHMRADTAAEYLDVSKAHFLAQIAPKLPQMNLGQRMRGFLKDDIDRWLDAQAGRTSADTPGTGNTWDDD